VNSGVRLRAIASIGLPDEDLGAPRPRPRMAAVRPRAIVPFIRSSIASSAGICAAWEIVTAHSLSSHPTGIRDARHNDY